jgi:hypothetical protein
VSLQAEEAPSLVAEMRVPTTPPPPAPATAVEEGEAATEATFTQAALETPSEAGPSVKGAVVVLDEDSATPPSIGEPRRPGGPGVGAGPGAGGDEPSPGRGGAGTLSGSRSSRTSPRPPAAEVAESSSTRVSLTVEEMMDLETCRCRAYSPGTHARKEE